ncbi:MAG: hypothetical protein EOP07_06965 [Proteobacteria bacterium]|nr:MAG: hypothetical protein EOP07_06965 [Pseudomonadota bacterium]
MKARFESLGAYLPPKKMSMKDRIAQMKNTPSFDLQHITGIQEIRIADGIKEDSYTMALAAAKDALSRSKYKAEDLDCIIVGSITRFINGEQRQLMFEPALSHSIKFALGRVYYHDRGDRCT